MWKTESRTSTSGFYLLIEQDEGFRRATITGTSFNAAGFSDVGESRREAIDRLADKLERLASALRKES